MRLSFIGRSIFFIILYGVIYSIILHPVLFVLPYQFFGGSRGDPAIYIIHTQHIIYHFPKYIFNALFFYPYGYSLAYTDSYLFPALISKIIYFLIKDLEISYNLPLFIAFVLNGYSVFLLAKILIKKTLPAFLSGVIFMLLPFFYWHLGHPQLQHFFWIPFAIVALIKFFSTGKSYYGILVGFCYLCLFFSSVYYALYLLVCLFLLTLSWVIKERSFKNIFKLFFLNLPNIIVLYLAIQPYLKVKSAFGHQPIILAKNFGANALSYLSANPRNMLFGKLTAQFTHLESYLFPGFLSLLLAIVAFQKLFGKKALLFFASSFIALLALDFACFFKINSIVSIRPLCVSLLLLCLLIASIKIFFLYYKTDKFWPATFLVVGVLFFILSFGVVSLESVKYLNIYYYLYKWLPGWDAMRASSRNGILADLILIIYGGYGASFVFYNIKYSSRIRRGLFIVFILITFLELNSIGFKSAENPLPSSLYEKFYQIKDKRPVLGLPYGDLDKNGLIYMRAQTEHVMNLIPTNHQIINGMSGKIPPYHIFLGRDLSKFPSKKATYALWKTPLLRYIIYSNHYSEKTFRKVKKRLVKFKKQYKIFWEDASGAILIFTPYIPLEYALKEGFFIKRRDTDVIFSFTIKKRADVNLSLSLSKKDMFFLSNNKLVNTLYIQKGISQLRVRILIKKGKLNVRPLHLCFSSDISNVVAKEVFLLDFKVEQKKKKI